MEAFKKEEETKQNQVKGFEKQLAGKYEELESKSNAVLELIEKNNEKISNLESSLKETINTLNQASCAAQYVRADGPATRVTGSKQSRGCS